MTAEMRAHYSAQNLAETTARTTVEMMAPMKIWMEPNWAQMTAEMRAHCSAQKTAETKARTKVEMMAPMKVLMLDW
eukprot:scaffold20383_cov85-Skeletonema_dohrnii-CCMP3373.AAC.1